ncbi:MAG TPA: exopolysaccharide biosynthesis polyprenyl glycosylphosphotransferase, partial [Hyphomicrobiaceae bacterium]|nr:exopolysaccharide biosynthesis polyprenyl glycosylphosphotransferase [Hyphomicrobiaceae bacterium]
MQISPAASGPIVDLPRLADLRAFDKSRLISPAVVSGLVRFGEFVVIGLLGLAIAFGYLGRVEVLESARYLAAVVLTGAVTIVAAHALETYATPLLSSPVRAMPRLLLAWMSAFGVLLTVMFLLKTGLEFSRVWLMVWFVAGAIGLAGWRFAVSAAIRSLMRQGRLNRRAVIYGGGPACEALIKALETDQNGDILIAGIFDDRGERVASKVAGYPKLGSVEDLINFCRFTRVDLLLVSLPVTAEERLLQILRKLWILPVDIRLTAHTTKLRFRPRAYSYIGSVPMIDLFDKPIADWDNVIKSAFDRVVAAVALVALAPVMALVGLAVRLDSKGPVLFRQKRYGFNNELIEVWKFRSMYVEQSDVDAARLVTRGDPRVTRVGRFIRKTSLDELPQLFNVLGGTLSLVGPRPHALQAK